MPVASGSGAHGTPSAYKTTTVKSGRVVTITDSKRADLSYLDLTGGIEDARIIVVAALSFPRQPELRAAYVTRNRFEHKLLEDADATFGPDAIRELLNLPSRRELQDAAERNATCGHAAGDLLTLVYESYLTDRRCLSERAAIRKYATWAIGKKDGQFAPLKYSPSQLRAHFHSAKPAVHLWAALRLFMTGRTRTEAQVICLSNEGLPSFLGVAKAIQLFATTFVPNRASNEAVLVEAIDLLLVPDAIPATTPILTLL